MHAPTRDDASQPRSTRFAPSPTGALHLGNARTFLINWALARKSGWSILLRIEDIDHPRVKPETVEQAHADLTWLGLDWDSEAPLQSTELAPCHQALNDLGRAGRIFACSLSRSEIAAAQSAPHDSDPGLRYEASLRPAHAGEQVANPDPSLTWRFLVDNTTQIVEDRFAGEHRFNIAEGVGDFPVWTATGGPAYQLAVTVDDARQGITDVVRASDLLPSAARQQAIQHVLGLPTPNWWHLPLVRGEDGRRLAKRHGDTRLSQLRETGVSACRVIGLMAYWCGLCPELTEFNSSDFLASFDLNLLPQEDITFRPEHLAWLNA
jgi:glutamyl-tRNA synthetase